MISLPKLVRFTHSQQFDRMFDEVTHNGRGLPLAARLRLSEVEAQPATALGLALQRVCDLTYRPTPASIVLLEGLLERQRSDGSFGGVSATAVALGALWSVVDQLRALPGSPSPHFIDQSLEDGLNGAVGQALAYLKSVQDGQAASRLFDEPDGLIGDEIDSAIVLWQLGLDTRFTSYIRYAELLESVDARGLRHDRSTAQLVGRFDAQAVDAGELVAA